MATMLVRDLMTADPFAVSAETTLAQVYDTMDAKHIRHLPVTDDEGRLIGLVTHRDIMRSSLDDRAELPLSEHREALRRAVVADIMTRDPESISQDQDLASAGDLILEYKFGCLPVVEEDKLVGILTEADFVRYVIDNLA